MRSLRDSAKLMEGFFLLISILEVMLKQLNKVSVGGEVVDFKLVFGGSEKVVPPDGRYSFCHQRKDVPDLLFVGIVHASVHLKVEFAFFEEGCKVLWLAIERGWGFEL
jgi:hypothetical protein